MSPVLTPLSPPACCPATLLVNRLPGGAGVGHKRSAGARPCAFKNGNFKRDARPDKVSSARARLEGEGGGGERFQLLRVR